MALRDLVEGECGGANSLVRLGAHFVQDRGLKEEGFRYPFPPGDGFVTSDSDQLVQQFLEETLGQTTPNFRMDSLLAEMRELERGGGGGPRTGPVQSPPVAQLAAELDDSCWADQYIEAGKHFNEGEQAAGIWTPEQDKPYNNNGLGEVFELGFGPKWAKEYLETSEQLQLDEPDSTFCNTTAIEDYKAELNKDSSELKDIANEIVENADDQKFTYSKFMKFMRQIGDGEVTIEDGEVLHGSEQEVSDTWSNEFSENQLGAQSGSKIDPDLNEKAFTDQLWNKLAHQWEKMSAEDDLLPHPWNMEYNDFSTAFKDYRFVSENPMKDLPDALEEGKKRLAAGDLPSAVLCFEAAAQSKPDDPLVWQYLGSTQAENEQDPMAIAALKKCLQLEPSNLTALMALAVCYTNENYQQQACSSLKEWLHVNPKYRDLVQLSEAQPLKMGDISTRMTRDLHKEVCDLYIAAARRNPLESIDPDVQCGLGVLFNLTNEQDKAADCFKAALQVRPDDARLWNRLGATYANGERSEEAVDAYHNALQLSPGFVRARYNLGITCTHLGAHREAVEHLLTALNQQAAGRGLQGEKSLTMSDTIWSTLRLVISLLDRRDLLSFVNKRDLVSLNKEFGIADDS